jgi:hypothetical protein
VAAVEALGLWLVGGQAELVPTSEDPVGLAVMDNGRREVAQRDTLPSTTSLTHALTDRG